MKNIHRAMALASLVLLLGVSSVFGQSDRQTVVNIPFNFTVGDKALVAGKYVIQQNRRDSDTVWVIKSKENGDAAVLLTRPVRLNKTSDQTKLVFRRYDDFYFLSEFFTVGNQTGREIQVSNREKALSKALSLNRQEYILIDRGR